MFRTFGRHILEVKSEKIGNRVARPVQRSEAVGCYLGQPCYTPWRLCYTPARGIPDRRQVRNSTLKGVLARFQGSFMKTVYTFNVGRS